MQPSLFLYSGTGPPNTQWSCNGLVAIGRLRIFDKKFLVKNSMANLHSSLILSPLEKLLRLSSYLSVT